MYFLVLETTYWSPERRNFSANLLKLALEETNIWSPVRNFAAMTGKPRAEQLAAQVTAPGLAQHAGHY